MTVYQLNDKSDGNGKLPSLAYLLSLIKTLEDELLKHENSVVAHQVYEGGTSTTYTSNIDYTSSDVDVEDMPVSTVVPDVHAEDVITDANHRFISDSDLAIFRDKPSSLEVSAAIMDLRNEIKTALATYFNNLLNTTDSVKKLKDIFTMISSSEKESAIMNALGTKISDEEFKKHTDSTVHLTNADRDALNQLVKFISLGCADWNATPEDANYIRNKPTRLPACGGDAETVMGYTIQDLYNTQLEEYIVGVTTSVDEDIDGTTINLNNETDNTVEWFFGIIKEDKEGVYSFKKGIYKADKIDLDYNIKANTHGDIIITGSGQKNTIFSFNSFKIDANVTFRDSGFIYTKLTVDEYAVFDGVEFTECEIILNSARFVTFRNCTFNSCSFRFDGACNNNMIVNNRFKTTIIPQYYGGNNLIANNLAY